MKIKTSQRSALLILIATLFVTTFCSTACKRAQEQGPAIKAAAGGHPLAGTIVSALPQNTTGIIYWNTLSDGYRAFKASPWGQVGSDSMLDYSLMSNLEIKQLVDILKSNGLDPSNKEVLETLFSEGVVFLTTNAESKDDPLSFGLAFKSKDQALVAKLADSIKKGFEAAGKPVSPVEINAGKAIKITIQIDKNDPRSTKDFFLGWQQNTGAICSRKDNLESILSNAPGNLPAALNTDTFQRAVKLLPAQNTQYSFGYIDIQATSRFLSAQNQTNPSISSAIADLPLQAAVVASGMGVAPYTEGRVFYSPKTESQKLFLSSIKQSNSSSLLNVLNTEPIFFLSLDGETIKNAKETYLKGIDPLQSQGMDQQLSVINNLKRIAISVKTAPIGKAMLPIPDLMLLAETTDGQKLVDTLSQVFSLLLTQSGTPPSWMNKKILGRDVKYYNSPIGIGVFLASTSNLLILTSTEEQMTAAIDTITGGGKAFTAQIGTEGKAALAEGASCANVYVNFGQVATLLQTVASFAQVYTAQNPELQKLFEPKQLETMRKLGAMVASVTVEDGAFVFRSTYVKSENRVN